MKYYVYKYLDQDDIPFYVGKGKKNRYKVQGHLGKNSSNSFLKSKIRKVGIDNIKIRFLHENVSEEEAFYWESYWIKYIGRRDLGIGTLCNLTDGGEGPSGYVHSEETKQQISKSMQGKMVGENNPMYGMTGEKNSMFGKLPWCAGKKLKPHTEEIKRKISEAKIGHKDSVETRRKKSVSAMGKKKTEEHRRKISESNQGKKMSVEACQKMKGAWKRRKARGEVPWNKGIPCSVETKRNISEAKLKRNKERKLNSDNK